MKRSLILALAVCLPAIAVAQVQTPPTTAPLGTAGAPTGTPIVPPSAISPLIPYDFSGDLLHRPALTGDWAGTRNTLRQKGLSLDVDLTQITQGNLTGGTHFGWPYLGSVNTILYLNTEKAGLWPGGFLKIHGETQFGESNNRHTGAILACDTNALYPTPEQSITTLSEVAYGQYFIPEICIILGKFQPRDANVFAHDEKEQFLNSAFVFDPVIGATMPLDFLTVGVLAMPTKWLTNKTLIVDSEGTATTSGFDTAFRRGTTIYNELEIAVNPFGLPGHQRLAGTYSDRVRTVIGTEPRLVASPMMGMPESSGSDWCFLYDFDQYLYAVPGHPDRGWGVFGRFGLSDGEVNPIEHFYSLGIAGKGLVPGRPSDTFGIGYYFLDTSHRIHNPFLGDEQGGELYYNIRVTPWMRLTPDLQILRPTRQDVDVTVVLGLRLQVKF